MSINMINMMDSSSSDVFDVVIIGAGLVGSAAARHVLALDASLRVALVGPIEGGPGFGAACHADEVRIRMTPYSDNIVLE